MKSVLFLCTGNVYRSRFAEAIFNFKARQNELLWRAISKGLAVTPQHKQQRIAYQTVYGLLERGIVLEGQYRLPEHVSELDLQQADLVIALDEEEHRTMLAAQFPDWKDRIYYWHVHDINQTQDRLALSQIEADIDALVSELEASSVPFALFSPAIDPYLGRMITSSVGLPMEINH